MMMICFCVAFGWSYLLDLKNLDLLALYEWELIVVHVYCLYAKLRVTFLHFVHLYFSYCISWKWPFIGTQI